MKLDCLWTFMAEYNINIMALTELNAAWDCLHYNDRLPAKTRGSWEASHWSISHNEQEQFGEDFQPSRMMILVHNKLSNKTMRPGDDPSGLGQWCWVHLRSKENHFLWVVSLYHPCKSDRHLTMYQQHVRWLLHQGKMYVHVSKSYIFISAN